MDAETLTIRAELIDDVGPGAAAVRGQVAGMAAGVKDLDAAGMAASSGGMTRLNNQFASLEKLGKSAGSAVSDLVGWVGDKLEAAAKRGAQALELLGLGAAAWGLKVTASLQQSRLAMDTFLGSVSAGDRMFNQLKALQGPFGIGALTQGAQSLLTAGASPDQAIALTKAIANISAPQVDPNGAFTGISQAVNRIQETGRLEPRALMAFMNNGVDVYGLLSREMGIPREQVRRTLQNMMTSGTGDVAAPTNFLADLANLSGPLAKFQGGLAAQRATLGGQASEAKVQVGQALAAMTAPVASWLQSSILPRVSGWAQGVEGRAPSAVPAIGRDLASGNMSGAAQLIDALVGGGGRLVPILDPLLKGLQSLYRIFRDDAIPLGKDLLAVAVPALHELDNALKFMADHKGLTEGVIGSLVGLAAVRAASGPINGMAGAFLNLKGAIGSGNFLGAVMAFLHGLTGINLGGGGTGPGGTVPVPGGGGRNKGPGIVGGIMGGAALYQSLTAKKVSAVGDLAAIGGGALLGAEIGSFLGPEGTVGGAIIGAAAGGVADLWHHVLAHHDPKKPGATDWSSDPNAPQWAKDARAKAKAAATGQAMGGETIHYYAGNIVVQANDPQQFQAAMEANAKARAERGYSSPYPVA